MGKRCCNKIDDVFFAPRIAHINWCTLCIMISEKREIVKNLGEFIDRQYLQCLQKLFSLGFGQHVDNLSCLFVDFQSRLPPHMFSLLWLSDSLVQGSIPREDPLKARHFPYLLALRIHPDDTRRCVHVPNWYTFRNFTEFAPQRRPPGDIFWGIPHLAVVDCVALVAGTPSLKL